MRLWGCVEVIFSFFFYHLPFLSHEHEASERSCRYFSRQFFFFLFSLFSTVSGESRGLRNQNKKVQSFGGLFGQT